MVFAPLKPARSRGDWGPKPPSATAARSAANWAAMTSSPTVGELSCVPSAEAPETLNASSAARANGTIDRFKCISSLLHCASRRCWMVIRQDRMRTTPQWASLRKSIADHFVVIGTIEFISAGHAGAIRGCRARGVAARDVRKSPAGLALSGSGETGWPRRTSLGALKGLKAAVPPMSSCDRAIGKEPSQVAAG